MKGQADLGNVSELVWWRCALSMLLSMSPWKALWPKGSLIPNLFYSGCNSKVLEFVLGPQQTLRCCWRGCTYLHKLSRWNVFSVFLYGCHFFFLLFLLLGSRGLKLLQPEEDTGPKSSPNWQEVIMETMNNLELWAKQVRWPSRSLLSGYTPEFIYMR